MKENAPKRTKWFSRYYHWIIFSLMFLQFFVIAGLGNNIYSLYTIPVTEELGISRSAFSLASTLGSIPAFFANLIFAYFYNRFGFRNLAAACLAMVGAVYASYAFTQNVMIFYVGAAVMGLVGVFYSTAGTSRVMSEWFHRHQGLLLGIVFAGSGVGSSVFSLILTSIMEAYSWRTAYGFTAVMFFLFAVLIFVLVRNKPADMGLLPLGDEQDKHEDRKKHARNVQEWEGVPLSVLKKRPYFYLTLAGLFLTAFMTYIVYPTLVSHMQDMGMTPSQAAQVQSLMFLFLSAAKILEGGLSDRFGAKRVMFLCVGCGIISALILAKVSTTPVAVIGVAVHSLVLTVTTIMLPVLTADVFGRYSYGSILGIVLAIMRLATGLAPTVSNAAYDLTGSYTGIYLAAAALGVLAVVVFVIAFRGAEKEKRIYLKKEEAV